MATVRSPTLSSTPAAAERADTAIRPFRVTIPEEEIVELRRKVAATRWPTWAAPRSWAEAVYPGLAYFNQADRGGHFAAWEEPALFTVELRAAFKPMR